MSLELDYDQHYMALQYHMEDALAENMMNTSVASSSPPYAIFSRKYYDEINMLDHTKIYDYCFIGSINSCYSRRIWVLEFVKQFFTSNSIFINTDNDPNWKSLGIFDSSTKGLGVCPKNHTNNQSRLAQYRIINDNKLYFETMCKSKYVLCPGGDAP